MSLAVTLSFLFFFFNDTATTEIYTLSLHDALPICQRGVEARERVFQSAEFLQHTTAIIVCFGGVRIRRQHGVILVQRFREAAERLQRIGAVVADLVISRA